MARPRVLVLRAPGTNCDQETAYAFDLAGAESVRLHVNQLIERPSLADNFQVLCFPGGFSYGDDIAAGRILATQIEAHLSDMIESFRAENRLVLGICNGFQIMMRLGIFFDAPKSRPPATLTWNAQGRFDDRWVHLKVTSDQTPFLRGIDTMYLPMAHAEGRFLTRDAAARDDMASNQQLALRYCDAEGNTGDEILSRPVNPNGAEMNVAGICDVSGNVFGLMPHPERHIHPTHHPYWTRRETQPEYGDGFAFFQNAVNFFN
jgi:phosphoribosylformylglycinamidine synthase subunit PurQ / glutaminase